MACLLSLWTYAGPISEQQALDKARSFLSSGGSSRRGMPRSATSLKLAAIRHYKASEQLMVPSLYVFNVGQDDGFVVVSGDDRLPPVLGYAGSGNFDEAVMPENMRAWLDEYSRQAEWLHSHPEATPARKAVKGADISPLLTTRWNQGSPYNEQCPKSGASHCMTGCVATAMAQVMYYHQWPKQTVAEIPAYTTEKLRLSVPAIAAGTTIDWANMLTSYYGGESSAQCAAVAQLMKLCGAAVEMNYNTGSSGAYIDVAADALRTYFNYEDNLKDREAYTYAQWCQMVYDELAAGRPVIYSGMSDYGYTSGHVFVVDGYGGDDFFHVNWGWGGFKDGYFLLSVLDDETPTGVGALTSIDGYSRGQCAVFGLQPDTGMPGPEEIKMSTTDISLPEGTSDTYTRASASDDFTFTVTGNMWNWTDGTNTFDCGAYGLFDMDGHLLAVGCGYSTQTYNRTYGSNIIKKTLNLGAGITSGCYKIKAVSRQAGTTAWLDNSYTPECFIQADINGNTLKLTAPSLSVEGSLRTTGKTERMSRLMLEATIVNNGTFLCREVSLFVGGTRVGGRLIEVPAGATVTLPISFTPTSAGTKEVVLCYYNSGYVPIASCTVNIAEASSASLTITQSAANAINGIVKEDKIVATANVKNNGSKTYDNVIVGELYRLLNDGSGMGTAVARVKKDIVVQPGESATTSLTFDNLDNGATYFYYLYYLSEGKMVGHVGGYSITVKAEEEQPLKGDVNGDGEVNVTDLVPLVNMILGVTPSSTAADVNGDGEVNVTDLVPLVNLILKY